MKKAKLAVEQQETNIVTDWLSKFSNDTSLNTVVTVPSEYVICNSQLELAFFQYFSDVVPTLIEEVNTNGFLKYKILNDEFKAKICKPLEDFIVGGTCEDGIKSLQVYSKPQKFCGKVFNVGDVTYSCKQCALDPTCVFCHFCFHNSVHKNHRYKLRASEGNGGFCDCGDEEAWSSDHACDYHKVGMDNDESWDPFSALPPDIQSRATFILLFVLQYIMELLIMKESDEHEDSNDEGGEHVQIPIDLSVGDVEKPFIVMLYNDEIHTYDEVISTLTETIKTQRHQAQQFAAIIDKEGRSSVFAGDDEKSQAILEETKRLSTRNGKPALKCKTVSQSVVAHQMVALDLMTWMSELMDNSDGLRRLLCLLTTVKVAGCHRAWERSFLEIVTLQDTTLWKDARARSHQLFMNVILMDVYGRREFALTFAKWYKQMIDKFLEDDHDHVISVASMSVQIFTVPSLAYMLMLNGNILKTCLECFLEKLKPAVGRNGWLDFQEKEESINISRANYILHDVLYLLRHKPNWTPEFQTAFLDAFDVFVNVLKIMQNMDAVARKTQTHVTYEPNWEPAFNLQLGMIPVTRQMISWCHSNGDILKAAVHRCVFTLRCLQPFKYTTAKKKIVVHHDVSTKLVSPHYALSRFVAGLIPGAYKYGFKLRDLLQMDTDQDDATVKQQLQVLEYPLRALVLSSQVNAQMWKRNGYAIHHQIFYYHNVRFVSEMLDRDVLSLQILACVMDHDHFIQAVLHKYNLINWSKGKPREEKDKEDDAAEKERVVAKDFLMTILYVLTERYVPGVGHVTRKEILEREVIHKLSLGPISRSALLKGLPSYKNDEDEDCSLETAIDDVLSNVAVYREPGVTGQGVFELKDILFEKCNKYFMHFNKTEQAKMVEEITRIHKKINKTSASYLHGFPTFHNNFKSIPRLVCCKSLMKLIQVVLCKTVKKDRFAEDQVEEVLMIIGVGLIELKKLREENNEKELKQFIFLELLRREKFWKFSNGQSIVSLIDELLANDTKEYYPIVKWVKQLLKDEILHEGNNPNVKNMEVDVTPLTTQDENAPPKSIDEVKAEKARISAERKKKMMEQINQMQAAFLKNNSTLFEQYCESEELMETEEATPKDSSFPIAISSKHTSFESSCMNALCILCQEEQSIDCFDNCFVVTSFISRSSVLTGNTYKTRTSDQHEHQRRERLTPEMSRPNMVNISSCGHIVHIQCWWKYFASVKERESLPYFQRLSRSCVDVALTEYLCPLCNSLCNTVLPLLPRTQTYQCTNHIDEEMIQDVDMTISEFLTYLERFSADVMSTTKKENTSEPPSKSTFLNKASILYNLWATYIGSEVAGASSENFMELFPKKILKTFGIENKPASYSVPYSWLACSFTIQSYECSNRVEGINLFSSISDRHNKFWYALVQYLANNCMIGVYEPVQDIGNVLFAFFCGVGGEVDVSILEADLFGMLISLRFFVACIQNIFQEEEPKLMNTSAPILDDVVFRITLLANLVKIYLTAPVFEAVTSTPCDEETSGFINSWRFIQSLVKKNDGTTPIDGDKLKEYVVDSLLPFMRCSAVFFHYLTGVKFPDTLTAVGSDEMCELQKYLNLGDNIGTILEDSLSEPLVRKMIERWCVHSEVTQFQESLVSIPCYVQARRLIKLPRDFTVLINRASGFMCPTLKRDSSGMPTLCLLCDTILCSQCYCCVKEEADSKRYGACSYHSMSCCADVGIFLRIRDCEVVLMYNRSKATLLPSPYLDAYGETDRGFRRGNPLYLNEKRYESLELLWLRQRIPETIAQALESSRSSNRIDFQQL